MAYMSKAPLEGNDKTSCKIFLSMSVEIMGVYHNWLRNQGNKPSLSLLVIYYGCNLSSWLTRSIIDIIIIIDFLTSNPVTPVLHHIEAALWIRLR